MKTTIFLVLLQIFGDAWMMAPKNYFGFQMPHFILNTDGQLIWNQDFGD